ncbi:MAG: hypothetical protein H7210_04470 [Pyrinomonadaceae bacterium]|nr:hypothetical protein [Phycisphaerales bacterium]
MSRIVIRSVSAAVLALLSTTPADAADTYNFVLAPQSTLSSTFSASAPFTGSLIGNFNAQTNPGGTRTLPGAFGGCGAGNQAIALSGTGTAAGSPSTTPTGVFGITFDPLAGTASLSGLNINLLGAATPTIATNVNLTYQSFHTCAPTGFFPSLPIPLDLGDATINTLTASQACSPSVGTLTHISGDTYSFSITTNILLAVVFTLNGAEQEGDPSVESVTLSGTAVLSGPSAAVNASINIMRQEKIPGPTPALINEPFDLPNPLGGTVHLLLTVTLTNSTVDLTGTAAITADGTLTSGRCAGDWNHDSKLNSQDFFDFITAFFGGAADLNCSGATDSQDFFDFLTAFFTGC